MKNYLVIGGSSGIGKEVIRQLSCDKENKIFATFSKNERNSINNVSYFFLDVKQKINFQIECDNLDGLVYCPGAIELKSFPRIKENEFLDDYEFQVLGFIKVLQYVLPLLRKNQNPSVVAFSTVAVQTGFPFHSIVSASKGAIEGIIRSLAAEFSPRIRVNAIAPSITDTPLANSLLNTEEKKKRSAERHPLKKIGSPEEISKAVLFLLDKESSWITGQIIPIDGGISNLRV